MEQMKTGLNTPQKKVLLDLARKTIGCHFNTGDGVPDVPKDEVFHKKKATFVTLKISGRLRGCIGHLKPVTSLWKSVGENARSAAFHDHRFSALTSLELSAIPSKSRGVQAKITRSGNMRTFFRIPLSQIR